MFKQLLNTKIQSPSADFGILIFRVAMALLLMRFGYEKLLNFMAGNHDFPDPIGIGPVASQALTVFAEFFCSIFLALGLLTRFALIPLIITMAVIFLVVHAKDDLNTKEHSLTFFLSFLLIFMTGAGKFSLDKMIFKK